MVEYVEPYRLSVNAEEIRFDGNVNANGESLWNKNSESFMENSSKETFDLLLQIQELE